ncbi:MAG: hypothetical protein AAGG01_02040 [Planctomycetota bacterium]
MDVRPGALGTAAAIVALTGASIAGLSAFPSCAPRTPEGTVRPFVREGRAGLIVVEGSEVFEGGEWLKHGPFVFRDELGEEISRGRYVKGLEDGPWTQRYEDGSKGVGAFVNGEREGRWQTFHPNGKLQDTGAYQRGLRTGTWVSLRDDGTRLRSAEYVEGKKEGQVTWYLKDGTTVNRKRSGLYRNDKLVE